MTCTIPTKEILKEIISSYESGESGDENILDKVNSILFRLSATANTSDTHEHHSELSLNRLRYLIVYYLHPEFIYSSKFGSVDFRQSNLSKCLNLYTQFTELLDSIGFDGITIHGDSKDPSTQRDLKIQRFKQHKRLESEVLEYKELLEDKPDSGLFHTTFNSSSPTQSTNHKDSDDDDDDDDDILREYLIRLLKYLYSLSQSQIHSIHAELDLLSNVNSNSTTDTRTRTQTPTNDSTWRLDSAVNAPANNLLDKEGRPTRPFTIMPRGTHTTRQQMADGVFQPSHRLPTMTIDEYLQDEQARGNVIQGGGPASENQPTSKEQLQLDTELDGTLFAQRAQDQQRADTENWARYTEEVEKGSGNTMANNG
ncbi:hypothetical protein E3P91_01376 [Wallemia ichthyophaga]|nr:hypothetical protein E3P91_01376 [Wallemia ichthyophaga]TIB64128.1 hypothetical protein E3P78_01397 [Wallemia ichthyophaga]